MSIDRLKILLFATAEFSHDSLFERFARRACRFDRTAIGRPRCVQKVVLFEVGCMLNLELFTNKPKTKNSFTRLLNQTQLRNSPEPIEEPSARLETYWNFDESAF